MYVGFERFCGFFCPTVNLNRNVTLFFLNGLITMVNIFNRLKINLRINSKYNYYLVSLLDVVRYDQESSKHTFR